MSALKVSFCRMSLLQIILIIGIILTAGCLPGGDCTSNEECPSAHYCQKDMGDCLGAGTCEIKPVGCPEILAPVCGCDGVTYENDCFAAEAGVNVSYEGECLEAQCWDNTMCKDDEYCLLEDCGIKSGLCTPRPEACPDVWDPVCGCNGRTYGNACEAAMAGVTVDYEGECGPGYCWGNEMCDENEYCLFEPCAIETGICVPRPEICPLYFDPVCGCDGNTYGNDCEAAAAGVSVDYPGTCKPVVQECTSSATCTAANEYCAKQSGDCDGQGICRLKPEACYDVWDPVCGCDGNTYGNDCEAAAAGVNIRYEGECEPQPCWSDSMCESGEYCVFQPCSIETGYCAAIPEACIDIYQPVCGCDMITYSNACYAAMAGISVLHEGPCLLTNIMTACVGLF